MQSIYLLTVKDNAHPGYEVLVEAFTDEAKLKEYLAQHVTLKTTAVVPGILEPAFDKQYKIQKMKANAGAIVESPEIPAVYPEAQLIEKEPEPELPYVSITVPSESDAYKTYGVSVNLKGEVQGCTCKAFEFHNQTACKHMLAAVYSLNPLNFGVPHLTIAREFYPDPWTSSKPVHPSQYTRGQVQPPVGTIESYMGNPGSWRGR